MRSVRQARFEINCINDCFIIRLQNFDCRNHIRVIQSIGDGSRIYVCGTNAHSPKDYVIYVSIYDS